MSDLISREKAYEVLTEYYHHKHFSQHIALREALDRVPDVTSEQIYKWIPTVSRIPEVGTYIVTVKQKYTWETDWRYYVDVAYCPGDYIDNHWDTSIDWCEGEETHITAWMPLPEPWRGEVNND